MGYTGQTFVKGQILTDSDLNTMSQGILEALNKQTDGGITSAQLGSLFEALNAIITLQYEIMGAQNSDANEFLLSANEISSVGAAVGAVLTANNQGRASWVVPTATTPSAPTEELPYVDTADNGKFLRVVDGVWTADRIAYAEDGLF